jgi:hypothetical protein
MTALVIAYPPSGGGNHLKNILCLDKSFGNSSDLDMDVYIRGEREVHCTTGRNVQPYRIDAAARDPHHEYIIHGHFGELATQRDQINAIVDKKFLVLTIDSDHDRYLLNVRQNRLGQMSHPYYLDEEQPYLYQPYFYQTYFTALPENIYTIALHEFWHKEITEYNIINRLNAFLNKRIPQEQAQFLHNHWHNNNQIDFY